MSCPITVPQVPQLFSTPFQYPSGIRYWSPTSQTSHHQPLGQPSRHDDFDLHDASAALELLTPDATILSDIDADSDENDAPFLDPTDHDFYPTKKAAKSKASRKRKPKAKKSKGSKSRSQAVDHPLTELSLNAPQPQSILILPDPAKPPIYLLNTRATLLPAPADAKLEVCDLLILHSPGAQGSEYEMYTCRVCARTYDGRNARSVARRHLQDKHGVPLSVQGRRSRWDDGESSGSLCAALTFLIETSEHLRCRLIDRTR